MARSDNHDEELKKFEGSLMYRSENCEKALQDLKDTHAQLQGAFSVGSTVTGKELNRIGRMHRYVWYAVSLEVTGLFDQRRDTLALPPLAIYLRKTEHPFASKFGERLADIQERYKKQLEALRLNRHTVVAHAGKTQLENLLLSTDEILAMPITELLKEVQDLVMEAVYFHGIKKEAGTMYMDVEV